MLFHLLLRKGYTIIFGADVVCSLYNKILENEQLNVDRQEIWENLRFVYTLFPNIWIKVLIEHAFERA